MAPQSPLQIIAINLKYIIHQLQFAYLLADMEGEKGWICKHLFLEFWALFNIGPKISPCMKTEINQL